MKKIYKAHQTLSFQFFTNRFSIFMFCFFMWFARFQIIISEPQSIWCKLLVLSWLYHWDLRPQLFGHNNSFLCSVTLFLPGFRKISFFDFDTFFFEIVSKSCHEIFFSFEFCIIAKRYIDFFLKIQTLSKNCWLKTYKFRNNLKRNTVFPLE